MRMTARRVLRSERRDEWFALGCGALLALLLTAALLVYLFVDL